MSNALIPTFTAPRSPPTSACHRIPGHDERFHYRCGITGKLFVLKMDEGHEPSLEDVCKIFEDNCMQGMYLGSLQYLMWRCWCCNGGNKNKEVTVAGQGRVYVWNDQCEHCGFQRGSEVVEYWRRSVTMRELRMHMNEGYEKSKRREGEESGDEDNGDGDWEEEVVEAVEELRSEFKNPHGSGV